MKIPSGAAKRCEGGVAGEGKLVVVPKFHSWGKCTYCAINEYSVRLDVQRFLWPVYYFKQILHAGLKLLNLKFN